MAKSKETFNKKEKEKKRLRKKKEKEEKKEVRKSNSNKGGDMDDMIAYVDEDGNITSTPPDPTVKKKKIELEDIAVSVSKQAPIDPEDLRRKGKVTFFNESKGYGFIKDLESQDSIFVHVKGLVDDVRENDQVTFETEKAPKGLSAIDVKLATLSLNILYKFLLLRRGTAIELPLLCLSRHLPIGTIKFHPKKIVFWFLQGWNYFYNRYFFSPIF